MSEVPRTDGRGVTVSGLWCVAGTDGAVLALVEPCAQDQDEATSLQAHLAQLPTLRDVLQRARQDDPHWEAQARTAKRNLRARLLRMVRAGKLSRVAMERMLRGWTQGELGARVGMPQANISRLEASGELTTRMAKRLAAVLQVDFRTLL